MKIGSNWGWAKEAKFSYKNRSFWKLMELSVNEQKEQLIFNLLKNETNSLFIKRNWTFKITNGY